MCGIFGVLSPYLKGNHQSLHEHKEKVNCALNLLAHRGPDGAGIWSSAEHGLILGHRRLSIIDVTDKGHQPFIDNKYGNVLTYNGEIYNYLELHNDYLSKYSFLSKSDTEVIYKLYLEKGNDTPIHLNGMFAFALWDNKRKNLFLSRDLLGEKPLYYSLIDGAFTFSSEIKPLAHFIGLNKLNIKSESISDFMSLGYIPGTNTIYEEIKELPPGYSLSVDESLNVTLTPYDKLQIPQCKKTTTSNEALEELDVLLRDSIKLRLRSDVDVGVFLSGGIDSGLIMALAAQLKPGIQAFSFSSNAEDLDEINLASEVAEKYGSKINKIIINQSELKDNIVNILSMYGEPFADASAIPSYYVSKHTSTFLKVALVGDGGDEVFGGYRRYQLSAAQDRVKKYFSKRNLMLSGKVIKSFLPSNNLYRSKLDFIKRAAEVLSLDELDAFLYQRGQGLNRSDFFKFGARLDGNSAFLNELLHAKSFTSILEKSMFMDLICELPYDLLVKMDIASMANSLEVRSPFLDKRLVRFGLSLPDNLKTTALNSKVLLRQLAKRYLPANIASAPKKGFEVPFIQWLKTDLKAFCHDVFMSDSAFIYEYFDCRVTKDFILKSLNNGTVDDLKKVWLFFCLEVWNIGLKSSLESKHGTTHARN